MSNEKNTEPESKVEVAKREGRHLRGSIAETLASEATHFGSDDIQLLKFHGTYQQDSRDERRSRAAAGGEKAYSFMVRVAVPAGAITAEQYLALEEIADEHANGTLRLTTRQGFQFHGVLKGDLKATIGRVNQKLLTTISACGDVQRNVMGCSAPLSDADHEAVRRVAESRARALRPAARANQEVWLDGEKQLSSEDEEPFYGDRATCRASSRARWASPATTAWTSTRRMSGSWQSWTTGGCRDSICSSVVDSA
jgi:sulfite reductase (ferredoxin)